MKKEYGKVDFDELEIMDLDEEAIEVMDVDIDEEVLELEQEIEGIKSWIERLLEYTELSEEDMKKIVLKDKLSSIDSQLSSSISTLGNNIKAIRELL